MARAKIGIIGATGSIGVQTISVIAENADKFEVVFLSAHQNASALKALGERVNAKHLILTGDGFGELERVIDDNELDIALVGASGTSIIPIAYQLACKGIRLAIANKECIVSAGRQIMAAARTHSSVIMPVDSEHSALFQCMAGNNRCDIASFILTASGGAFRDTPADKLKDVTVKDATTNPNWKMGRKITIDSATMMNKGLELIEAHMLFDIEPKKLQVVIHPQSIVHSMVSYLDGSTLAQMGNPDMRVPISYALGYPDRLNSGVSPLDFSKAMELSFCPPDLKKYKCLDIAIRVLNGGKSAEMIAMNAINELAVDAFVKEKLSFVGIGDMIERCLADLSYAEPNSVEDVLEIDESVRKRVLNG
ncbi:MAG: 1-deoxy-D-xylulose-5-phosphate reductoisomerase [Deferribacteraceae bacterium]|jgi:1-deoxy-D-xylulose-5-phosphate reductoisomerase|nr:1-deoxy-D-xylulose-5-phosphate reductoisomerase [Deferribacteraceae bacterium]